MEVRDYIHAIRQNWVLVLITIVLGVGIAATYSAIKTPVYQSDSKVFLSAQGATSVADLSEGNLFAQQAIGSYTEIVTTPIVLRPVIETLGLEYTETELAEAVEATAGSDSSVIQIVVSDPSATRAADIANQVAASFSTFVAGLAPPSADTPSPIQVTTVQEAVPAESPSSPNLPLNLVLGLLLALPIGLALAVLKSVVDTRVRSARDVTAITATPVIGLIPFDRGVSGQPLVIDRAPQSSTAESVRALRTNLEFVDFGTHAKSYVFTSALAGEGKTTSVANLAIALTDNNYRVALIDADLRRPRVADLFGLEGAVGLSDVLIERATLEDALQPWGGRSLSILPAGQIPPNPSELLDSPSMGRLLDQLSQRFDIVLIDAPPLLPVTDAVVLSRRTGGTVLVVAAGKTAKRFVQEALTVLKAVDAKIVGVVLTMLPDSGSDTRQYGYSSHETTASGTTERHRRRPDASAV